MFAIAFDLDTEMLKQSYHNESYNNAYGDIRRILTPLGFDWQQGSVYFGQPHINSVKCMLAAQKLAKELPWFRASIRDMRMLRIADMDDLKEAIEAMADV